MQVEPDPTDCSDSTCAVSLVVPLFNEEESLRPLWEAIARVLPRIEGPTEVIFVDDGNTDGTCALARRLKDEGAPVRLLKLKRNFGQTPAMAAGLDHARGRVVVTLDGDLQNDPADIPELLAEIDRGHDLVCGWRKDRQDTYLTRILPSRVANWIIGRITGVRIHDYGCTLKAFRSEVVRHLNLYADQHRFIPAIAAGHGRAGEGDPGEPPPPSPTAFRSTESAARSRSCWI